MLFFVDAAEKQRRKILTALRRKAQVCLTDALKTQTPKLAKEGYLLSFQVDFYTCFGKVAPLAWIIPTMTPNRPKALPKISTISIFTKSSGL
mmetsp:Transcript_92579/g.167253  ORF Transcript_92579/g.167253 Transcript_92579/m.167253 type:complete len:92 (+) Transcript_92579:77-352(+)